MLATFSIREFMYFIITIDTEGDNQWDHGRDLTVENIKYIPRFQELCEKYGISPTYLITSEVCLDGYSKELFSRYVKNDVAEVGAHLHSWTTPPFMEQDGFRENDNNHAFASELPYDLLKQKISNLTDQIMACCGKRPTSFRSGRYGFNADTAKALLENSYLVDSSVTPFVSWASHKGVPGGPGGPDFIKYSPYPFNYNLKEGSLEEIPITIAPTRFPLNSNWRLAQYYFNHVNNSLVLRAFRKLFYSSQPVWARPVPGMTIDSFRSLLSEIKSKRLPFLTMMFHSSELMPGCSKYRPDNESIEELYVLLEDFFKLLERNQINSVTLTEATNRYEE